MIACPKATLLVNDFDVKKHEKMPTYVFCPGVNEQERHAGGKDLPQDAAKPEEAL